MHDVRILVAASLAILSVSALAFLVWTYLDIPSLRHVPPDNVETERVSVIVAARDEGRHIRVAIEALLAQGFPDFDVVAVDDRSTDDTGRTLDALAAENPRLRVVHVRELPPGWLGKNHALHVGALQADGAILLFTDGDVVLRRDALARAVRLMRVASADHLAVAVDVHSPTWPLALVVNYFMMWFVLALRAWRVRIRDSSAYVGIGAFNLVRSSAYRAAGGHATIRMRPDDDVMLGKILKRAGCAQLLAVGDGCVTVTWYHSLRELARGLRKNAFAAFQYSIALALAALLGGIALTVWPFVAVWLSTGVERACYAVAILAQLVGYVGCAALQRNRAWLAPLYPIAACAMSYICAAAVIRTIRLGGIEWRGTFYPLRDLRANRA